MPHLKSNNIVFYLKYSVVSSFSLVDVICKLLHAYQGVLQRRVVRVCGLGVFLQIVDKHDIHFLYQTDSWVCAKVWHSAVVHKHTRSACKKI